MGYAVLHMEKAIGPDSGTSAHIERTVIPKNADASRTHLNREMIAFPNGVTNRTEAIQHRLETAGLQRKIGKNQVRAVRIMLSGSPGDMKRIEQVGTLDDWCRDNLDWLKKIYGAENIVSAVVHLDETTPHIHATMIPIVTGERRKAKAEQTTGKKKYRKKSTDTARLCADDVMSRVRLKEYQDSYAEQMAKYGLQRGIDGSQAKHVTTSRYYRDLLTQSESVQENITDLLEQKQQAEQELSSVKADIKKEKLKNSAADVGATLLDGVGSLFGSSKTKQQQQQIEALTAENRNLSNDIKELSTKIRTIEADHSHRMVKIQQHHQKEMEQKEVEHRKEVSLLKTIISKAASWFPHFREMLRMENLCHLVGFNNEQTTTLIRGKSLEYSGTLYSEEYKRNFETECITARIVADDIDHRKLTLKINGLSVSEWFKEQLDKLKQTIHRPVQPQIKSRGFKL